MIVQEAMKTGKKFRHKDAVLRGLTGYYSVKEVRTLMADYGTDYFTEALLTDGWEVSEERVEVTRTTLAKALGSYVNTKQLDTVCVELGFKS